MATVLQMFKNAKKLTPNRIQNDFFKFIKLSEEKFLELEKNRIQNESKDIFGNPLGFYSYATEVLSKGRKKKGEPFSGYNTGNFFKGFYMQEVSGVLRFGSKDSKTNTILNGKSWLSNELFGLSDNELKEIIRIELLPFMIKNVRQILDV